VLTITLYSLKASKTTALFPTCWRSFVTVKTALLAAVGVSHFLLSIELGFRYARVDFFASS
jgi:hypothetical protein